MSNKVIRLSDILSGNAKKLFQRLKIFLNPKTTQSYSTCQETNKIWNEVNRLYVLESSKSSFTKCDEISNHSAPSVTANIQKRSLEPRYKYRRNEKQFYCKAFKDSNGGVLLV